MTINSISDIRIENEFKHDEISVIFTHRDISAEFVDKEKSFIIITDNTQESWGSNISENFLRITAPYSVTADPNAIFEKLSELLPNKSLKKIELFF